MLKSDRRGGAGSALAPYSARRCTAMASASPCSPAPRRVSVCAADAACQPSSRAGSGDDPCAGVDACRCARRVRFAGVSAAGLGVASPSAAPTKASKRSGHQPPSWWINTPPVRGLASAARMPCRPSRSASSRRASSGAPRRQLRRRRTRPGTRAWAIVTRPAAVSLAGADMPPRHVGCPTKTVFSAQQPRRWARWLRAAMRLEASAPVAPRGQGSAGAAGRECTRAFVTKP
jgi:hypothetical protein